MKKLLPSLFLFLSPFAHAACLPADFTTPRPTTETVAGCFESAATKSEVRYEVTFPAGYDPEKPAPFAIFLHGRGGNEGQFREFGGPEALNKLVNEGGTPFVVIAPGEPRHSYWKDGPNGEFGTAKMITEDLVQHVEAMPGIRAGDRSHRAIMGISMGGHGSFYMAEKKPELFSALYAMSPVFRDYADLLPEDQVAFGSAEQFLKQDPVTLYENRLLQNQAPFPGLRTSLEIGADDPFLRDSPRTHDFIHALQTDWGTGLVDFSRPGGHDSGYWRNAFERATKFLSDSFAEISTTENRCAADFARLSATR